MNNKRKMKKKRYRRRNAMMKVDAHKGWLKLWIPVLI
jgi:hypothetical protein